MLNCEHTSMQTFTDTHTGHVYIVQTPTHRQPTHTYIQHTIRCRQFINFLGVTFADFAFYINFASADVVFKYLLVKYKYIFANMQSVSGAAVQPFSVTVMVFRVPVMFLLCTQLSSVLFLLIRWHSNICRQVYYTTADL